MMSPARARGTRLDQLEAALTTSARCATPAKSDPQPDDWFRDDGEPFAAWVIRRQELLAYCRACPVLAECREVGLRLDANTSDSADDFVRGGMTARQLADTRTSPRHAASIDRAIAADDRPTERGYYDAYQRLLRAAQTIHERTSSRRTKNTERVIELRDEVARRRADHRQVSRQTPAA